jgi:hypothetical protein
LALGRAVVSRLSFATPQFSCTRNERDWFLYLAYSAGERPGTVLRRFAEAYANGALVPFIPELGEPKNQRRLIHPADRAIHSFVLEAELSKRAYERARADGNSLSAIMRRFVVDYVLRERTLREDARLVRESSAQLPIASEAKAKKKVA